MAAPEVSQLVLDARDGNLAAVRAAVALAPPPSSMEGKEMEEDNPSPTEEHRAVALWAACTQGHEEIVAELLTNGADLDYMDDTGFTALLWACESSELSCVRRLIEAGANVNARTVSGATPLIMSCDLSHPQQDIEIARALIEAGADVNLADSQGATALSFAAEAGFVPAVELLIGAGANVNAQDSDNQTPLLRVAQHSPVNSSEEGYDIAKVAELLIEANASVNAVDNDGDTALILAAKAKNLNLVAVLLKAHADPTIANEAGETPASSAALALLTTINPVERAALENIRVKCSGQEIELGTATTRIGAGLAKRKRRKQG